MKAVVVLVALAACYPGVDNSDCEITCGTGGACPSNLSCVAGYCVSEGQVCVDPDLAAAYSFEEIVGNSIADLSGNGNTIGLSASPELAPGHNGMALSLNGIDQSGEIPNSPSLELANNAITVSCWVLVVQEDTTFDDAIVAKVSGRTDIQYEWGIEFDDSDNNGIDFYLGDADHALQGPFTVKERDNEFFHLAFTYDGSTVVGYVNGQRQMITSRNPKLDQVIPELHEVIEIGTDNNGGQHFHGSIDDLRIYRRALTDEEIARDMNTPLQ